MKNETNVDPYVKWDNTCIKVLSKEHGAKVIEFWKSVGIHTSGMIGNVINDHYGLFDGDFNGFTSKKYWENKRILTLEEAIAIRDSETKTFPREMYVWNNDSSGLIKRNVVFIVKDHCNKYNVMTYNNGVWTSYQHAMEIDEYEAMNKNKELLDEISNTKKQMNELNDKLSQLQDKLKY